MGDYSKAKEEYDVLVSKENYVKDIESKNKKLKLKNKKLQSENKALREKLNTCKHDYWVMTNLLENYTTDKEKAVKDCIERMKFRKPLFNELTQTGSKG